MKNLLLGAAMIAASFSFGSSAAQAEVTQCVEITALPATISAPGVYCLKQNLGTSQASGAAITINANNVTFEMNGYRLGGATAGLGTLADGIYADDRKNIIIRNGAIRGFYHGIYIDGSTTTSSGHIVEDMLIDGNRFTGIRVHGSNTTVRNNNVTNTGPTSASTGAVGIHVGEGTGTLVKGNTISGLDETGNTFGIIVDLFNDAKVIDNTVFDLGNGTNKFGIRSSISDRVLFKGNTISTGNGGTRGIGTDVAISQNIACVNNEVTGFTTSFSNCDTVSGNVEY